MTVLSIAPQPLPAATKGSNAILVTRAIATLTTVDGPPVPSLVMSRTGVAPNQHKQQISSRPLPVAEPLARSGGSNMKKKPPAPEKREQPQTSATEVKETNKIAASEPASAPERATSAASRPPHPPLSSCRLCCPPPCPPHALNHISSLL